jgi:hypothetical protein
MNNQTNNDTWQANFIDADEIKELQCHVVYLVALLKLGKPPGTLTIPYRYKYRLLFMQDKISKATDKTGLTTCFTEIDPAISLLLSLNEQRDNLELWKCEAYGKILDDPNRKSHQKSVAVMYIKPMEYLGNYPEVAALYRARKRAR